MEASGLHRRRLRAAHPHSGRFSSSHDVRSVHYRHARRPGGADLLHVPQLAQAPGATREELQSKIAARRRGHDATSASSARSSRSTTRRTRSIIETTPGTRAHASTARRSPAWSSPIAVSDDVDRASSCRGDRADGEPEYGERVDERADSASRRDARRQEVGRLDATRSRPARPAPMLRGLQQRKQNT